MSLASWPTLASPGLRLKVMLPSSPTSTSLRPRNSPLPCAAAAAAAAAAPRDLLPSAPPSGGSPATTPSATPSPSGPGSACTGASGQSQVAPPEATTQDAAHRVPQQAASIGNRSSALISYDYAPYHCSRPLSEWGHRRSQAKSAKHMQRILVRYADPKFQRKISRRQFCDAERDAKACLSCSRLLLALPAAAPAEQAHALTVCMTLEHCLTVRQGGAMMKCGYNNQFSVATAQHSCISMAVTGRS